jgi:hypothetical protein
VMTKLVKGRSPGQLPQEVLTTPTAPFMAALVVGTLLVTAAANLGAMKLLEAFPQNRGYRTIREAWSELDNQDSESDWVVLGDSGCGHAVVPQILEETLGGSVAKLCSLGNMALLDDAWMLDEYIHRYGAPRGVVIVHVYDVWKRGRPPLGLLAQVPRAFGFWGRFEPALDLDWRASLDVFMARHLPLVGERASLKNLFRRDLAAVPALLVRDERDSDEGLVTDTAGVMRDLRNHLDGIESNRFAVSQMNLEALSRIVELAHEFGFEVYVANSPLWEELAANQSFQDYNDELQAALATYARLEPSVHYLEGTSTFDLYSMIRTVDHILPAAATVYSRDLAERIARSQVAAVTVH